MSPQQGDTTYFSPSDEGLYPLSSASLRIGCCSIRWIFWTILILLAVTDLRYSPPRGEILERLTANSMTVDISQCQNTYKFGAISHKELLDAFPSGHCGP